VSVPTSTVDVPKKEHTMNETQAERRGHTFLPAETTIPALYSTEEVRAGNKMLTLHYFIGESHWYLCELDPTTGIGFGWAILSGNIQDAEWGYVSLEELETLNFRGFIVERDTDWNPCPAREVLPPKAWNFD